jgi:hypothetical protein
MKRIAFVSCFSLFFLSLTLAPLTVAHTEGPSANGSFKISFENGQSREVQFDARVAQDGNTTGEITFQDTGVVVRTPKNADDEEVSPALTPFYAKATCDCLVVQGVEAALSGTVTDSSRKSFIGRRVVVVVQDGDSLTPPLRDKLTFGFYGKPLNVLGATDGERPDEQGPAAWVASDAERADDTGVILQKNQEVTCTSFPIGSFNFLGASQGKGQIQVTR